MTRRHAYLAAAVVCAFLALPAIASAKDYCAGFPGCTGTSINAFEVSSTLAAAQSNGTADRIFLGPGVNTYGPFSYQSPERLEIIGLGAGQTVLRGNAGTVLSLGGNPASSVRDLTVSTVGGATIGVSLSGTQAKGVAVDGTAASSSAYGVAMGGGAHFDAGSVNLGDSTATGILVAAGTATVTDSRLTVPKGYGLWTTGTEATIRRSTLEAKTGAWVSTGRLVVSDTLVDLRGKGSYAAGPAIGVTAGPGAGATKAEADLDRVTIVGSTPTTGETIGVAAGANGASQSAAIRVRDSVISGSGTPLARQGINGATVNLSTDRSFYETVIPIDGGPGSLVEQYHLTGDPGFVDEPGGNFHLAPGSQLVDAGTPGPLPAGTTDRDGNPRPRDGDGDGAAISDVGAFERPGTGGTAAGGSTPGGADTAVPSTGPVAPAGQAAPQLSRLRVSPARIAIGARLRIRFTLTEPARVELRFARVIRRGKATRIKPRVRVRARQGANRIRLAARLNRRLRLAPGTYRLTAIATDSTGARSKPVRTRFSVVRPAAAAERPHPAAR